MERIAAASHRLLPVVSSAEGPCFGEQGFQPLSAAGVRRTVLLVALDWTRLKDPRLSLGHVSLLAALKAADRATSYSLSYSINQPDFRVEAVIADVLRYARATSPGECDVAIGVYVWNEQYTVDLLRGLRQAGFEGRIVLGGPQISYSGLGLEARYPQADVFVRGYGEAALVAITATSARMTMTGVHFAGEPDREETASVDLLSLPSPFLADLVELRGQRFMRWESQRGCPYRCSFCQHREPGARLRRRALSSKRLCDEIALFAKHRLDRIAILDPIFNIGKHALSVLDQFRHHGFAGELSLQCRFELITDEFLDACAGLNVCLEFGLQTASPSEAQLIDRPNDLQKVRRVCSELRARRIPFEVSLIYGLPTQTLTSFKNSVDFCLAEQVPTIRAFPLMLLRGTPLERDRKRWELVESEDPIPAVIASNSFTENDHRQMVRVARALAATEGVHPRSVDELLRYPELPAPSGANYSPPWRMEAEESAAPYST